MAEGKSIFRTLGRQFPLTESEESKMAHPIEKRIARLIDSASSAVRLPNAYPYLRAIIESLEYMKDHLNLDHQERERVAGGLGRLVTEDFAFSESHLGTELLELADEFAAMSS